MLFAGDLLGVGQIKHPASDSVVIHYASATARKRHGFLSSIL